MFKLISCLLFLGVVFGEVDDENGLKSYFRSLYPNNVEKAPTYDRSNHRTCSRRNLDNEKEKNLDALSMSQPSQVIQQPDNSNPAIIQIEGYPVISSDDIKDCIVKKIKSKINQKLLDTQQLEEKQNQQPLVTDNPVLEKSIEETSTPTPSTVKNESQSDSPHINPDNSTVRQGDFMIKPLTPRPTTNKCDDYTDNYPDIRDSIRRSYNSNSPPNVMEAGNGNEVKNNDQQSNRGSEELEDPSNRFGVSVYSKANAMIPGSTRICYACSTLNNPTCTKPSKLTTVKYCSYDKNSCVTKSYDGLDGPILIRDCARACNDTILPYGLTPKYKTCSVCHSDLCNAGFSINKENIIIVFFISLATLYRSMSLK